MSRIVIIGNSGSGKTTLASRLGGILGSPVVHLDELFWQPGGFGRKRPKEIVMEEVRELAQSSSWIVEGVFGELAHVFLPQASVLIWLDLDWATCLASLQQREGLQSDQVDSAGAEASFQRLLVWAEQYWQRDDLRSYAGHRRIYTAFEGEKYHLEQRSAVDRVLDVLTGTGTQHSNPSPGRGRR